MRTLDGRLLADLNDNVSARITGSVEVLTTSSINENDTTYILLPERINAVPYISSSILNTSEPQIKPIQFNEPDRYNLFIDAQGVVKVAVGSSFKLKVVAKQPPIYNVENGVPTIYEDQTNLAYEWQRDGEPISSLVDITRNNSFIRTTGSFNQEIIFENVSPKFTGTYFCVISNDVGSVESEQIAIEVYNPDLEDFFYRNLVDNPYGKSGTDGWSADMEFKADRFSNAPFRDFSEPWNTNVFGYSIDMMYPRPYHINTYHIKNSNLAQDLMQEGYYFTREQYKYKAKDGKAIVTATYDIDLTPIQEYIQGSIWGIEGVRAVFGCYIGNAISKYTVSLVNALITRRSNKYTLLPTRMRLDIVNCLLAGMPARTEDVKVVVQEFDNETPLLSGTNFTEPGKTFYDEWTNRTWNLDYRISIGEFGATGLKVDPQSPGNTQQDKLIYLAQSNELYPNQTYVPTYGQYIAFNRGVFDKLNFKTNKIRITIVFQQYDDVLNVTNKSYMENGGGECFEFNPWELIAKPLVWPTRIEDYASDNKVPPNYLNVDWYNQTTLGISGNSPYDYTTILGPPRGMVTGLNLVLIPLEKNTSNKAQYYTEKILQVEQSPKYPKLQTGISSATALGAYMASLADYDFDVIGVNIQNRYNLPYQGKKTKGNFSVDTDKESGKSLDTNEAATRTTISTYRYEKATPILTPNASEYPSSATTNAFDAKQHVWRLFNINSDSNLNPANDPNEPVTVIYNTEVADITSCHLSQVIGNIASTLFKYVNVVADVPEYFESSSITKSSLLTNMGFNMTLVGEDYGITTQVTGTLSDEELANKRFDDWRAFNGVVGTTTLDARMLYRLGTTTPVNATSQHIIYSTKFNSNWTNNPTYITSEPRTVLTGAFVFSTGSEVEVGLGPFGGQGVGLTPGAAGTNAITRARITAFAVGYREAQWTAVNLQAVKFNGDPYPKNLLREVTTLGTATVDNSIPTIPRYSRSASLRYVGNNLNRVKLSSIKNYGDFRTPAAIVFPNRKKVYYFVYSYDDNYYNEAI